MTWQDPRAASANSTGLAAWSVPPSAGGSSTVKLWSRTLTRTSVLVPGLRVWATLKETAALCGSASTALRVPSMTSVSDMGTPGDRDRDLAQGGRFRKRSLGFSSPGSRGVPRCGSACDTRRSADHGGGGLLIDPAKAQLAPR